MVICVDLGATEIKFAQMEQGRLCSQVQKLPTNANCGKEGILASLHTAISMCSPSGAQGIAIATAGTVDETQGVITFATQNLPNMTGFNFEHFCLQHFNLPATVINDAHAALLGEVFVQPSLKKGKVAMLTLGSGVGGAYCVDGISAATEKNDFARFGHLCLHEGGKLCTCGKHGCAEMYLSGRALHLAAEQTQANLFEDFVAGKPNGVQVVEQFSADFRLLLQKIHKICPFDVCIVGGGVVQWIGQAFCKVFADINYTVVPAQLGNNAGVVGAYANFVAKRGEQ